MTHIETTMADWLANGPRYVSEGVTSVRIINKEPATSVKGERYWCPDTAGIPESYYDIPRLIAPKISFHATREDANAFLSESCIIWARQQLKEKAS
jgi:hypothetical protein